ncbi:MAG: winged helix-turn-helix domain-containing protein [Nitrososphaerota archaeon]|nr:winged helix-turn-helix domain-containing protein [Candidatus Bathyarchaeota archaeon]MDW8048363.1 winged helix-turn-helix domain-containing protein [Nitrososphaerota archaeon]
MKRSTFDIAIDVLKIIKSGCNKPTRIMYKSNLSWIPLQRTLDFLMKSGCIVEKTVNQRKEYHITEKGLMVLKYHAECMTMLTGRTEFPPL